MSNAKCSSIALTSAPINRAPSPLPLWLRIGSLSPLLRDLLASTWRGLFKALLSGAFLNRRHWKVLLTARAGPSTVLDSSGSWGTAIWRRTDGRQQPAAAPRKELQIFERGFNHGWIFIASILYFWVKGHFFDLDILKKLI